MEQARFRYDGFLAWLADGDEDAVSTSTPLCADNSRLCSVASDKDAPPGKSIEHVLEDEKDTCEFRFRIHRVKIQISVDIRQRDRQTC